jgi:FAD:protein FMN transferase
MEYYTFRAMNTDIQLAAEGPAGATQEGFERTRALIESSERRFTRFSEESELSALNRSSGDWFDASAEMFDLITLAVRLHEETQGIFDPAILNALEDAGYDRSMDEIRHKGARSGHVMTRPRPQHFQDVFLDDENRRIWLPPGLRIDLGGIAKGWIAEQAAAFLTEWADTCAVDAGGDIFMIGIPSGADTWRVTLEDPTNPEKGLALLKSGPGALATSAITKRRWDQDGQVRHHLIDPRTQQPAQTDWLSVTVFADHAAEAEVYAKTLLIGGSRDYEKMAPLYAGIEFIAVDGKNKMWGSKHSREFLDV